MTARRSPKNRPPRRPDSHTAATRDRATKNTASILGRVATILSRDPWALTDEEQDHLEAAPWRWTDAEWQRWAGVIAIVMAEEYRAGEIPLEQALKAVWTSSLGCRDEDRNAVRLGMVQRALLEPPVKPVDKRRSPTVTKRLAVSLIDLLREQHPRENIVPTNGTSRLLELALGQLAWLHLLKEPITPWQLYHHWYLKAR